MPEDRNDEMREHMRAKAEAMARHALNDFAIPTNLHGGLIRYVFEHIETGSFLRAVLENDLDHAVTRADPVSAQALPRLLRWLDMYAPAASWGTKERVADWIANKLPRPR